VSADDVVDRPGRRCAPSSIRSTTFDQSPEHGLGFEPREPLPGAGVGAVAEAELAGGVAADVEGVGAP